MPEKLTRREMLHGEPLAAALGASKNGFPRTALSGALVGPRPHNTGCDTLVVLFLRGAADGLNIVVPYAEQDYYRLRPTLALPAPNAPGAGSRECLSDLDGFFGFHPALAPLLPLYHAGSLAVVHAVGSYDETRSHFHSMATMERGLGTGEGGEASGWLARHLTVTATTHDPPLRAIALSDTMPDSLRGATAAALTELSDYRIKPPTGAGYRPFHQTEEERANALADTLRGLYDTSGKSGDMLRTSGTATLEKRSS